MSSRQRLAAGAAPVDLVDEHEHWELGGANRPGEPAGLGLHALDGRDHQHHAVEHAQRPLDLGDKVAVPGGIYEIDLELVQLKRNHRGFDGDAAGAFQIQGVGLRRALVDTPDRLDDTGLEEDALSQAGLTSVDMRQDSDIDNRHAVQHSR